MHPSMQDTADSIMLAEKLVALVKSDPEIVKLFPVMQKMLHVSKIPPANDHTIRNTCLCLRMEVGFPIKEAEAMMPIIKSLFGYEVILIPETLDMELIDRDKIIKDLENILKFLKRDM